MQRRAGIYLRISRDRDGTGLAIDRQRSDAEGLVERRGWTNAGEWTDTAVTASGKQQRTGFTSLIAAVNSGEIDAVIAWDLSRLARNPRDRLTLVETCRERGVIIALVRGSDLDPTTSSGRLYIGLMGEVAEHELSVITERIQAEKQQAATAGRYRGGPRPYGYEADGRTLVPTEARFVADATQRLLNGESTTSIVRWANDHGYTTTTGKPWQPVTLRRVLTRARNAGLLEREHRGVKRDDPDVVTDGDWPAIVTREQWRQVVRICADPTRRRSPSNDHRWLLAGVARCGRCGATMKSGSNRASGGYAAAYRCSRTAHLSRLAGPLDDYITEVVIARLSAPDAAEIFVEQPPEVDTGALHAERAELVEGQQRLSRALGRGKMSEAVHDNEFDRIQSDIDRIDATLAASVTQHPAGVIATAADIDEAWAALTVGQRKAVLRQLLTVTVLPGQRGSKGFHPDTVEIVWH